MKKFLTITAIFFFLTSNATAGTLDIEIEEIEAEPGFVSLTQILPTEEISFDLTEFKELKTNILDAKIVLIQGESNKSSSVLNLKNNEGQIIKAVSAADLGKKDFLGLKDIVVKFIEEGDEMILTLEGNDIDPNVPLYFTEIKLQIGYEIIDVKPPKIKNLKIDEITPNSVLISWETNEDAFSRIKYGKTSNYSQIVDENLPATSDTEEEVDKYSTKHSALLLNLFPGTTYHFKILSEDKSGNVVESENQTVLTPLTSNESSVLGSSVDLRNSITNLTGQLLNNGSFQIDLKWSLESSEDFDGFLIYRQIGNSVMQQIARLDSFETTYSDKDLLEGQVYKYLVRSYKDSNVSPQSNIFQIDVDPSNLESNSFFVNVDITKIIIFVGAITLGLLIVSYFVFSRVKSLVRSVTTDRLGKNKLRDADYIQTDFEKRFTP
jgi:hypothetical protein